MRIDSRNQNVSVSSLDFRSSGNEGLFQLNMELCENSKLRLWRAKWADRDRHSHCQNDKMAWSFIIAAALFICRKSGDLRSLRAACLLPLAPSPETNAAVLLTFSLPMMISPSPEEHRLAQIPASVSRFICSVLPCNEAQVKTKEALVTPRQNRTDPVIHIWVHYYHRHQAEPGKAGDLSSGQPHTHEGTVVRLECVNSWHLVTLPSCFVSRVRDA